MTSALVMKIVFSRCRGYGGRSSSTRLKGVLGRRVSGITTSATTVMRSNPTTACMELPLLGCVRARAELVVFEYAYSPRHGVGIGSHGTRLGGGGVAMKRGGDECVV